MSDSASSTPKNGRTAGGHFSAKPTVVKSTRLKGKFNYLDAIAEAICKVPLFALVADLFNVI